MQHWRIRCFVILVVAATLTVSACATGSLEVDPAAIAITPDTPGRLTVTAVGSETGEFREVLFGVLFGGIPQLATSFLDSCEAGIPFASLGGPFDETAQDGPELSANETLTLDLNVHACEDVAPGSYTLRIGLWDQIAFVRRVDVGVTVPAR